MFKKSLLVAAISAISLSAPAFSAPSSDEMWKTIQSQQNEIQQLKSQVAATADAFESSFASGSKLAQWAEKTSIGGYGELHYNNLNNQLSGGSADKDEIDLHRFVLFFGHQFSDDVRFYSELEVEHAIAGEGKAGEVEVEQAFVEWGYTENHHVKAGSFLIPVGIINETHEPDTFYGVERNPVEKNIIPATWWEGGLAFSGTLSAGLNYDLAISSGLSLADGKYKVRDGRQKVGEANADDFAYTARLKYTAIQGLELAATVQYQEDLLQGEQHSSGAKNVDGVLIEGHAVYQVDALSVRALYAQWNLDRALSTSQSGADEQKGWYLEPAYKVNEKLGVFARYGEWDNQAGDQADSKYKQLDFGANYWVTETVVAKVDYQIQSAPSGNDEFDGLSLGVGWSF